MGEVFFFTTISSVTQHLIALLSFFSCIAAIRARKIAIAGGKAAAAGPERSSFVTGQTLVADGGRVTGDGGKRRLTKRCQRLVEAHSAWGLSVSVRSLDQNATDSKK